MLPGKWAFIEKVGKELLDWVMEAFIRVNDLVTSIWFVDGMIERIKCFKFRESSCKYLGLNQLREVNW